MKNRQKFRLLTRSDFDGLVCAMLLRELDIMDDIKFVHPKDVQDGKIQVTHKDILTNLPYVKEAFLCFDHHDSEEIRNESTDMENYVLCADASSAARVVYNYYGGADKFPHFKEDLLRAVDKADSGRFTRDDVLDPQGWEFLSFLMDPRTGLGRFREFRVSNYQLMMDLIDYCCDHSQEQVLTHPDVRERVQLYNEHTPKAIEQIRRCTTVHGNLAVLDLRNEDVIFAANRFLIYALFPECNISMHVIWGKDRVNTVFALGKSIFDRSCATSIGELCLSHGGGGHDAAGTCQVDNDRADQVQQELIERINQDAGALTCA